MTPGLEHRSAGQTGQLALDTGHRYLVRRHVIAAGDGLASMAHLHRDETWVIVQGTARVTMGGRAQLVSEGQSLVVPAATGHRLENPGHIPLIMIAVLTGDYLGEDDQMMADLTPNLS